jgi:peptidoglycan hydrolase-like protein with peptidoglycan-binding domain
MSLKDPTLQASTQIVDASNSSPSLKKGSKGQGVQILQAALIDLGYRMPDSTRKTDKPGGLYGKETSDVVAEFQKKNGLKQDGIAGRRTDAILDERIAVRPKPAKTVARPRAPKLKSSEYKVGRADPPIRPDPKPGHGDWAAGISTSRGRTAA